MAEIRTTPDTVTVDLTRAERLWSLHGDVSVPRSAVTAATVHDDALAQVRGIRAPGLGVPGLIKIGTWRGRWGKDLVVARRGEAALVVELSGAPWRRLIVGYPDRASAERTAQAVR